MGTWVGQIAVLEEKFAWFAFGTKLLTLIHNTIMGYTLSWKYESSNLKSILSGMDLNRAFNTRNIVCSRAAWSSLHEIYCNQLQQYVLDKPKLRTYVKFKVSYNVEDYVMSFMSHAQRSCLAQLKCGILPLHIETGRWQGTQLDKRICKVCSSNSVENEEHFIFHCNKYNNTRSNFYQQICNNILSFLNNSDHDKFKILMEKGNVNVFSRFICNIYRERQDVLFKKNN